MSEIFFWFAILFIIGSAVAGLAHLASIGRRIREAETGGTPVNRRKGWLFEAVVGDGDGGGDGGGD
ncbi:hypothetical protein HT585_13565 [Ensifer sp. HO-A22]|uniref:Uncharacterized protein n=1 Tax=Ensifer oleiphilus TaxID=2742698 RepID=A0A7Y6Q6B3_9HYPH|nr:hypothetical protein [Ensifer oleiphilus]NVD39889.1 hypothetical protein [Ensifer oleiphilus]